MRKIENFAQISDLLNAQLKRGVRKFLKLFVGFARETCNKC